MKMYLRKYGDKKGTESNVPNVLALTFIKKFLSENSFEQVRKEYFINNLSTNQVNLGMKDIKWLLKEYKGLDIVTIENENGDITKFIL